MAISDVARPLTYVTPSERVDYLKRVLTWTAGGLILSGITGTGTAMALYVAASLEMYFVFNQFVQLAVILGSFGIAQYLAPRLVFGSAKVFGFGLAATFQGIAMGYLLLSATLMGAELFGNPFTLTGGAMALTGLTGIGMAAYVWTGPKEFNRLGAMLAAVSMPMLLLMGVSFVFPSLFGGVMGTILSAVFVVVSAGGLLYQINQVIHKRNTNEHIEGAYMITMGVLVLYWNILALLMRLNRR